VIANNNGHLENTHLNLCTASIVIQRGKKRYEFMVAANVLSINNINLFNGVTL
jgi:hypothetical protein